MSDIADPAEGAAELRVENALLRASLWLAARRLKDYQEAPAAKFSEDRRDMLQLNVPAALHQSAAEALAKAQSLLKQPGHERTA